MIFNVPSGYISPMSPVQKYLVPSISIKLIFSFDASAKYPLATTFPPMRISPLGFGVSVFLYCPSSQSRKRISQDTNGYPARPTLISYSNC